MEEATRLAVKSLLERYAKVNTSLDDLITRVKNREKIGEFDLELVKNELNNLNIVIDSLNTLYKESSNSNYYNSLNPTPTGGRRRRNRRKTRKL